MTAVRLVFDRGTLLLEGLPVDFDLGGVPDVLWDPRVGAYRAPARVFYALAAELRRRGVPLTDRPLPKLRPPSRFRAPALRPYQEVALAAWRGGGRRGVVVLPTGSGKTHVAIAAIAGTNTPALCLVPTRALLGQWAEALATACGDPDQIGCFGDGDRIVRSITVATYASAYRNMSRLGDHFGLLIIDEVHHFGHGSLDDALEMSIAPLRLGLTATPVPTGPAHDRQAVLVGPVVFQLSIADLAGEFLAPLERIVWRMALDRDERAEFDALTGIYRRALRAFSGNHLDASWDDFVRAAGRTDEGRIGLAAWRRTRRLLAFPRCKQRALAILLARHQSQRVLIFVADNETAYAIARQHLVMPLTCDIGRVERQAVLDRFSAGQLRALVSAQVLNEGLDVPDAEVAIVVAGRLGEREHIQRVGRVLRPLPGKRALIYELVVEQSSEVRQAERRWQSLAPRRRSAA